MLYECLTQHNLSSGKKREKYRLRFYTASELVCLNYFEVKTGSMKEKMAKGLDSQRKLFIEPIYKKRKSLSTSMRDTDSVSGLNLDHV